MDSDKQPLMDADPSPDPLILPSASFFKYMPRREDARRSSSLMRYCVACFTKKRVSQDLELFDVGDIKDVLKKDSKEKGGKTKYYATAKEVYAEDSMDTFEKEKLLDEPSSDDE